MARYGYWILVYFAFSFLLTVPFWFTYDSNTIWFGVYVLILGFAAHWAIIDDQISKVKMQYFDKIRTKENEVNQIKLEYQQKELQINTLLASEKDKTGVFIQELKNKRPWSDVLVDQIDYYEKLKDEDVVDTLRTKSHPALKASEVVKEQTKARREALRSERVANSIIEYYETIAPFLVDLKDEVIGEDESINESLLAEYSEEERSDEATNYLTKEEYRSLPPVQRYQMALDRFWQRPHSKWMIGKLYERYVGYLYEAQGYKVSYDGIIKGYEDLGRDIICEKDGELIIIQCKNWSQFKTIYEKHIFQFFGTVFQYKDANKDKNVKAIFYTTTKLSDLARRFAKELGIELIENHSFDRSYPSIKCNINKQNSEKIYHLPFDQQYDKVKIEPHIGELYCKTVAEAETLGFRRAFRWKGSID